MATFRNATATIGDFPSFIYEAPLGTTAIVLHCQIVNTQDTGNRTVSLKYTDSSFPYQQTTFLVAGATVKFGEPLNPIGGKLVLEEFDFLEASQDSFMDEVQVSLSVLELPN